MGNLMGCNCSDSEMSDLNISRCCNKICFDVNIYKNEKVDLLIIDEYD